MTAAPQVRGWCPGALRPMLSGDGLVARPRPPMGRLTSAQARGIADLAAMHGSGVIDLSNRANLQMRGVRESGHPELVEGLAALGLVDGSPEAEARRNIVVTPFHAAGDGTEGIAAALAGGLAAADAPSLPAKFGFALDTGPARVLAAVPHDIAITRLVVGKVAVHPAGATHGAPCPDEDAAALALDLARWFLSTGGAPDGRGRMAAHPGRAGPPPPFAACPLPAARPVPIPGLHPQGALVALAFGQTDAATLAALGALGPLRLTPWRMLLLEGARELPDGPGIITDPADPLLRVVACTGAPGCPQARGATRTLARHLAPLVPAGQLLHVAGCTKGCAHPGPAPLTLTATPGGFLRIAGGTAADAGSPVTLTDLMGAHAAPL